MNIHNTDPLPGGSRIEIDDETWIKIQYNAQFAVAYGGWVNTNTGEVTTGAVLLKSNK